MLPVAVMLPPVNLSRKKQHVITETSDCGSAAGLAQRLLIGGRKLRDLPARLGNGCIEQPFRSITGKAMVL